LVPDSSTALAIGEVLLKKYFGDEKIESEMPLGVVLKGDSIWVVHGTYAKLSKEKRARYRDGRAVIRFRKKDCKVVGIEHGK